MPAFCMCSMLLRAAAVVGLEMNAACGMHPCMVNLAGCMRERRTRQPKSVQGLCSFNLLQDKAHCPICCTEIEPVSCGFVGCAWLYDGCKQGPGGTLICCSSDWQVCSLHFRTIQTCFGTGLNA